MAACITAGRLLLDYSNQSPIPPQMGHWERLPATER
jgi:hypothetical protein